MKNELLKKVIFRKMSVEELIKGRQFEIKEYGQFYDGTFREDFRLTHPGWTGACPAQSHIMDMSAYNTAYNAFQRPIKLTEEQKVMQKLGKVTFKEPASIFVYRAKRLIFPVNSNEDVDDIYRLIGAIIDTYPNEKFDAQNNYSNSYGILPKYQERCDKMLKEREKQLEAVRCRIEEVLEKEFDGKFSIACPHNDDSNGGLFNSSEDNLLEDFIVANEEIPREWYGQRCKGFVTLLFVVSPDNSSFSSLVNTLPC